MNSFKTDTIEIRKKMIDNRINSISELSIRSGVNRNTLGDILSGKSQPSSDVMERLVITLNMEPEEAGRIFFKPNLRDA